VVLCGDRGISIGFIVDDFLNDQERCRISSPRIKRAFEEALSRIPDCVYNILVHGERPLYVAESSRIVGVVALSCREGSGMTLLALNRELDGCPRREVVGIIAHELAHLALGHRFVSWEGKRQLRLKEEYEADALACQWGFREELRAALEALIGVEEEARRRRERVS
jgi:hypothetical protein